MLTELASHANSEANRAANRDANCDANRKLAVLIESIYYHYLTHTSLLKLPNNVRRILLQLTNGPCASVKIPYTTAVNNRTGSHAHPFRIKPELLKVNS